MNPGYDEKKGEVPVNFVFNVSTGNTASTRMSQANVQATSSDIFRGMDETALMSFKLPNDNKYVTTPTTGINKLYGLGPILGYNDIGPNSETTSRRVLELSVPVGTNALMFYGKAKKDLNSDDTQGKITMNLNGGLNNISFSLCPRIPEGESTAEYNQTTFGNYQQLLSTIINSVVQSKFYGVVSYGSGKTIEEANAITWEAYGTIVSGTTKTLKEKKSTGKIAEGDGDPADPTKLICGLGEILSSAFVNFNKFYDSETTTDLRAGSGFAVQNMLGDLYTVINAVANATPTNMEEAVAKALACQIIFNLDKVLDNGASFRHISQIKTNMGLTSLVMPTEDDNLIKFPSVFGVPEGAAILKYDLSKNTYSYRASIPTYNMGGGDNFELKNYMYPAELCYFGNSPIRHSSTDIEISAYPQGTTAWDNESSWTGWSNGHVESSTREVAMRYNINYGTSLLKTQVKYGAATIEDNNFNIQKERKGTTTEANQTFDVSTTSPFTLTGVIIGGQTPTVGWDFLPKSTSSATAMIYDRDVAAGQSAIPSYTSGGAKTSPVYTLVWDNWDASVSDQNVIYVALEFKNNSGKAFWGETNLIPDGGTFYITGKLEPDITSENQLTALGKSAEEYAADKSLGITWPTKYALPPYDNDGTIKKRRVFIQDFMTAATFVIGQYSLQKAMIAVPDLRASQLSVGLSVDLEWSTGLSFNDIILGN